MSTEDKTVIEETTEKTTEETIEKTDEKTAEETDAAEAATIAGSAEAAETDEAAEAVDLRADGDTEEAGIGAAETDARATPPGPARGRRWVRVLASVLAVLLVASAGLTAWLYFHTYRPDQAVGQSASDVVLQQAKDATVAVLSYSPEDLDKNLEAAKSHLTGDFLNYYSQFTDQVIRPAVQTKKVSTTANVVRAAVSEMHPDQAKVLVFVNQTTTSSDREEPSLTASSVVVTMDKVDGKWLISAFDPV